MKRRDFLKTSVVAGAALSIDFTGLQAALSSNTMAVEQAPEMVAVMGGEPEVMLDKALDTLGGIGKYIKKGQKVVIKPNIGWDRRFFHQNDLQQCIADICTWQKKPVLNIVDAYRMMHQNGPQGKSAADVATLKSMIVSPNIIAIDTAALALFNQVKKLDMEAVSHISKGEELKLGTTDLKKVNIKRIKI